MKWYSVLILSLLIGANSIVFAQDDKEEKKEEVKKKSKGYDKFLQDDVETFTGMFKVYRLEKEVYFEIPDSLLERDMLLGARVDQLSNTSKVMYGEMRNGPIHIFFSRDDEMVYMHLYTNDDEVDPEDPIKVAVNRHKLVPILNTFEIEALNQDSSGAVIDVTNFFSEEIPNVSPFNSKYKAGKLDAKSTRILDVRSFPNNIEINTEMNYTNTTTDPFMIHMHRSLLLLPKTPMRPRLEDRRIGYFAGSKTVYSSEKIGVESFRFINRFDIQPKPEDIERYKAGELVEPAKPIVFYIDDAFPPEWFEYIKAGVEDWQPAFEAIGFKNAIVGRPYPKDDPNFHPGDLRYSCIRYISSPKANSMGPRWVDPRSGEVIGGSVLWWHGVTELLRDWRFVQCAAVEEAARERHLNTELIGELIRYVAAHELGHVLGLKHNMRASFAFPVDSLRSATFTQKNGTTPSIMDYARFNYIAQPGDDGVRFSPPHLGPYDKYAIMWGYKPIFKAETPDDEMEILNQWILEKAGDPVYQYGDQQTGICFDPASQNEALGNDVVKASEYGLKNLKYIMAHLIEWTLEENDTYEYMRHMYDQIIKQYERYLGHVLSNLSGVNIYLSVEGENKDFYTPVSKSIQEASINWLFQQLNDEPEWILNSEVEKRLGTQKYELFKMQAKTLDQMMASGILQKLFMYHNDLTPKEYLAWVFDRVWAKTKKGEALNQFERHLQATYIHNLMGMSDYKSVKGSDESLNMAPEALSNANASKVQFLDNLAKPLLLEKIEETKALLKKNLKHKDYETRVHYKYLYTLLQ